MPRRLVPLDARQRHAYNAGQDGTLRDHHSNYMPGALNKRAAGTRRLEDRAEDTPDTIE